MSELFEAFVNYISSKISKKKETFNLFDKIFLGVFLIIIAIGIFNNL